LEAVGIWEIQEVYETKLAAYREWVMQKYADLKNVAEMDISLRNGTKEPDRKRPAKGD
jgi:hypothetical protein